jgi:hypothetical protein
LGRLGKALLQVKSLRFALTVADDGTKPAAPIESYVDADDIEIELFHDLGKLADMVVGKLFQQAPQIS